MCFLILCICKLRNGYGYFLIIWAVSVRFHFLGLSGGLLFVVMNAFRNCKYLKFFYCFELTLSQILLLIGTLVNCFLPVQSMIFQIIIFKIIEVPLDFEFSVYLKYVKTKHVLDNFILLKFMEFSLNLILVVMKDFISLKLSRYMVCSIYI